MLIIGVSKLFSQSFTYDDKGGAWIQITPTFEEKLTQGKQEFILYLPQSRYKELFERIYTTCLTVSKIELLRKNGLIVRMYISSKCDIFYVDFRLRRELRQYIDETDLLTIYKAFRNTKLDFSEGTATPGIEGTTIPTIDKLTDNYFAKIVGSLVPKH